MAKFIALLVLALIAISMIATTAMANSHTNALHNAIEDVGGHSTASPVYSSVTNAVRSVSVFLLDTMATSNLVLATITGRQREEDQSALDHHKL
ncbi:hypothetical protein ACH5RR_007703 [Cinchona calisaya]|uniref:Uncharacterized protein n=1 Tax=Cinchona calisaya TaxID=153742 RepID=A0ABD3A9G3_9GENT